MEIWVLLLLSFSYWASLMLSYCMSLNICCFTHQSMLSSLTLCTLFKLHEDYSSMGDASLDAIFETFQWPTILSLRELAIEKLLWD